MSFNSDTAHLNYTYKAISGVCAHTQYIEGQTQAELLCIVVTKALEILPKD